MYIVTLIHGIGSEAGESRIEIQNEYHKLSSGTVIQGINAIDSCTFSINMANPGFDLINDFKTHIEVLNTKTGRIDFYGRVLCSTVSMDENGFIQKDVTCESALGYLCDSQQNVGGAFTHPSLEVRLRNYITQHNGWLMDEPYKKFNFVDLSWIPESYESKKDESFWENQKSTFELFQDIVKELGGELKFYRENGENYLEYVDRIGAPKNTEIALSKNMKSITKDIDPTELVTRLIPLGAEGKDGTRLRLSEGSIDDEEAIKVYGVHIGVVEFDDAADQATLRQKAQAWLKSQNKVPVKYSVTSLDLFLLDLDIDDFEIGNDYPLNNSLLNINDRGRIVKKNSNLCDETKTTIELGTNFKSMSELQQDSLRKINARFSEIRRNYVLNKTFQSENARLQSIIEQSEDSILFKVEETESGAKVVLNAKVGKDANNQIVSMLNMSSDIINISGNRLTIESDNFILDADGILYASNGIFDGYIDATDGIFRGKIFAKEGGDIGGWSVTEKGLKKTLTDEQGRTHILRFNSKPDGAGSNRIISIENVTDYSNIETFAVYKDGSFVSRNAYNGRSIQINGGEFWIETQTETNADGEAVIPLMYIRTSSADYYAIYLDVSGADVGDEVDIIAKKMNG